MKYAQLSPKWKKVAKHMIVKYVQDGYDAIVKEHRELGENIPFEKVTNKWSEVQDILDLDAEFEIERNVCTDKLELIRT